MKNFKTYFMFLALFALVFTSCSKDENQASDSEKATLSFGAVVEDLASRAANKQAMADFPECSDDVPAYVEIVLMQGEMEVVGTAGDPFRVDLVAGQLFTKEVAELELEPGTYSLNHFAVYNADGALIWLAPKGGIFADWVDYALPLDINLGAGVKKYVDVSVVCYDDRNVNEYGYLFFEIDANRAYEFCFFANYCTPDGRHYPARYSLDLSIDGVDLYTGMINNVGMNNDGDYYADPICAALPDLSEYADDEEYIDYTLTLLDWDANYGDVEPMVITGSLSRAEIMANFDGAENVYYEHVRFGCDDDPVIVTDCIPAPAEGCETLMFAETVDVLGFPVNTDPFYPLYVDGVEVGTITFDLAAAGAFTMDASVDLYEGWAASDVEVSLPDFVDTEICLQDINENDFTVTYEVDATDFPDGINYPVDVEFAANICQ